MATRKKAALRKAQNPSKLKKETNLPVVFKPKTEKLPSRVDPNSPLSIYMREVGKYPLLTPEKELELAKRVFEDGDQEAFKILVQSNLRFVLKIAFQYAKYGAKVLDLIQEGNMGLIKAVQEFNPNKNVRMTTYAVWWIRSYIQDFLLKNWSLVRVGTTAAQKKLFYRLKQEQDKLEKAGIQITPKAIAMNLNVSENDVEIMQQRMSGRDKSLSAPLGHTDEGNEIRLEEKVADDTPLASMNLEDKEQMTLFKKALEEFQKELDPRELDIFSRRLMSENPVTLLDLGKDYNVSKERMRQLEERIKTKLKDFLSTKYPDISID